MNSDPMRASALAWLTTPEGEALLTEAAQMPDDRLTRIERLRKRCPASVASTAVELLELRRRARAKFANAEAMYFTAEGLEQSTGEEIGTYRAQRFPEGVPVLDACCGIGGDAQALAMRGPVLAVDRDLATAVCTRANAGLVKPTAPTMRHRTHVLCADVTTLDLKRLRAGGVGAAFFDPSRRADSAFGGRRRARQAEDYAPPLSWLETLRATFPALAVKVSPALEDATIRQYAPEQVEFLSAQGECKEIGFWFGALAETIPPCTLPAFAAEGAARGLDPDLRNRRVTILTPNALPQSLLPYACDTPPLAEPRAWLYEPDPAVIRAHLVPQVAAPVEAAWLDPQIAYLTADTYRDLFPFATAYPILDWMPFNQKRIQVWLRTHGSRVVAIKKRGVPFEPETLGKRLEAAGDTPVVLVLTRRADRPIALFCAPPVRGRQPS